MGVLQRPGHTLAVSHRGTKPAPADLCQIRGDHHQLSASAQELKRFAPDVVIDFVVSSGTQAEELMTIFRGVAQRLVMLSSMDVYRAVGVFQGTEAGPADGVAAYEDSELRRSLYLYPPEVLRAMRKVFPWVTDDYDKVPAERIVMQRQRTARYSSAASDGVRARRSPASFLSDLKAYC